MLAQGNKRVKLALFYILVLAAMAYMLNQVRKPTRWVGRFFLWAMNISHSGVTDWGLSHVHIDKDFTILDVGCGGGRTISKLAAIATKGTVYGIDYSKGSVAASRHHNAAEIKAGRVEIRHASVSHLPFPDEKFDLVMAVETHYYWPDLAADMKEIRRVLKPGGALIMIAESYKRGKYGTLQGLAMKPLRAAQLSVDEHRELFSAAGFSDVQIFENKSKGWVCAVGRAVE